MRDAVAGVTLASMTIPQVLGYTRIAATPVVTGLYTVLLPLVAFAVFGSSRHLVVAADSATAAIFSGSLSHMVEPASEKYMALVGMVALLTAGFLLFARVFKLGFLADFLSRPEALLPADRSTSREGLDFYESTAVDPTEARAVLVHSLLVPSVPGPVSIERDPELTFMTLPVDEWVG